MKTSIRFAVAAAAISTVALAGCSSDSSDAGASAPATTAASSPAPTATASDPAGDPETSAPESPTTSEAPATPDSPTTSEAPGESGALASKTQLVALAKKVGCTNAKPMKPKKSAPAAQFGIPWAVNCLANSNQYIIMSADPGQQDNIIKSLMADAWSSSKEVGYVSGDGWMVIGGDADSKQPPVRKDAEEIQKVVGGTVKVVK